LINARVTCVYDVPELNVYLYETLTSLCKDVDTLTSNYSGKFKVKHLPTISCIMHAIASITGISQIRYYLRHKKHNVTQNNATVSTGHKDSTKLH